MSSAQRRHCPPSTAWRPVTRSSIFRLNRSRANPPGGARHALHAEADAITSAWTSASLSSRAWARHLGHGLSEPRSPVARVLATPCATRTTATSRTSRGAGAPGPEAPAEQQEEVVGQGGRENWVSAHARTRLAVLQSWVRAHPSTKARLGWRVARSEHFSSSTSGLAEAAQCKAQCRSTGVRGGDQAGQRPSRRRSPTAVSWAQECSVDG